MFNCNVLQECYELYSVEDPAVDKEKSDLDSYRKTLDKNYLKHNEQPSVFSVRPLTMMEVAKYRQRLGTSAEDYEKIFLACFDIVCDAIVNIQNFYVGDTLLNFSKDKASTVEALRSPELIIELANYIMEVSQSPFSISQKEDTEQSSH